MIEGSRNLPNAVLALQVYARRVVNAAGRADDPILIAGYGKLLDAIDLVAAGFLAELAMVEAGTLNAEAYNAPGLSSLTPSRS